LARNSGILLHLTSLPGRFGIGDMGKEAYRFADFLKSVGQHLWQMLPLGPTGYGNSPYQCLSVFAGNPLLISLEKLAEDGLLEPAELKKHRYSRSTPWILLPYPNVSYPCYAGPLLSLRIMHRQPKKRNSPISAVKMSGGWIILPFLWRFEKLMDLNHGMHGRKISGSGIRTQ